MNKSISIVIILFSFLLISWHPYRPNLDKKNDNLKGNVKTLIEYVWDCGDKFIIVKEYNKNGKLIEIKYYGLSNFEDNMVYGSFPDSIKSLTDTNKLLLLYIDKYEYSASGNLNRHKRFDVKENTYYYISSLYYNEKDSLIAISNIRFQEKDSILTDSTNIYFSYYKNTTTKTIVNNSMDTVMLVTYYFNKQGSIDSTVTYKEKNCNCLSTERYIYDEFGRLRLKTKIGKPKYSFDNCNIEREISTFNEYGNIIKEEYINEDEFDNKRKEIIFEYDTLKKIKKILNFNYEYNILDSFSESLYNGNNDYTNWYAVDYYIDDDNILVEIPTKESCIYEYDSNGNWTKVKRYRMGQLDSEDKRIINYYE